MNKKLPSETRNANLPATLLISTLFLYFFGKMLYFALSIGGNISPDEVTWLGQSIVFSKTFLLPENSPDTYQFGLVTNIPYLYPWLMGKIIHLNVFGLSDLVFLRLVNVGIGMATLWFGWKTIQLLSRNTVTRVLFVVMASNTLMLTFLNSFVSYDNLVNLLAITGLYCLILFFERRSVSHLLLSAIFILLGCLTKITFLPLAVLMLVALVFREYRQLGTLARELGNCFRFRDARQSIMMILCVFLLALNLDLHLRNLIEHRSLNVSAESVIGLDNAMQNRVFARNHISSQFREGKLSKQQAYLMAMTRIQHEEDRKGAFILINIAEREKSQQSPPRLDRFRYAFGWTDAMLGKVFGILGHKSMEKLNTTLVPYLLVFLLVVALMIRKFRICDLGGNAVVLLLLVAGYAAILMQYVNYSIYDKTGAISLAVQGRYLFPVLFAAYVLTAHYLTSFESKRLNIAVAVAVSALFIIGEFPWFLNQVSPDWYFAD